MYTARPIVTWYKGSSRPAHSVTTQAAARAAFRRVLDGQYDTAWIYKGNICIAAIYLDEDKYVVVTRLHRPRMFNITK